MPSSSTSAVGRMPPFIERVLDLEERERDPEDHGADRERTDRLRPELADAELEVVEDAGHTRRRRRRALGGEVPAGAVLTAGEDADGQHTEEAADAVHRDRTDRVVDAALLDERESPRITITAAMMPITAAAQKSTNAHGAVIATRPASMPFAIMPGSGFPNRRCA